MSEDDNQSPVPQHELNEFNLQELDQNASISDQPQNNQMPNNEKEEVVSDNENAAEEGSDLQEGGYETLIDMFSYYFLKYMDESDKSTPSPSYFTNLSNDEINLLRVFKQYYNLYKDRK